MKSNITTLVQRVISQPFLPIALIVFLLFFYRLGSWALFDADEGRYAAIPREMLVNGDWITPTLNHIKFFDKPPLLYWGIASAFRVFGFTEFAARLISALAATLGVLLAWALGRRMFGERVGRLSAIILSTCLLWPVLARVVVTDMLVSSLVFVALALWWLGHVEKKSNKQTLFFLAFWSALALAVLAKGPVTLVLVSGTLFSYCLFCKQWKALREMRFLLGLPLFFAIAAPWFILVATRNPEFNNYFWYDQHIARFLGKSISGADHVVGIDYFIKLIPVIFFPWTAFLPAAILAAFFALRQNDSPRRRAGIFLLCSAGFITLFFSSSSSKLITYLLPILPPTAILLAAYFDRLLRAQNRAQNNRTLWAGAFVLSGVLLIGAIAAWQRGAPKALELGVGAPIIAALCLLLALWAGTILAAAWRRRTRDLVIATAGGFVLIFAGAASLVSAIAPQFTTPSLIAYIRPGLDAGATVETMPFTQSVGFYAGRRVRMIGSPSELEFGVRQMSPSEKHQWITDDDETNEHLHFQSALKLGSPVYFVVRKTKRDRESLKELSASPADLAPIPIIENQRFLVLGNQAAAALTPPAPRPTP